MNGTTRSDTPHSDTRRLDDFTCRSFSTLRLHINHRTSTHNTRPIHTITQQQEHHSTRHTMRFTLICNTAEQLSLLASLTSVDWISPVFRRQTTQTRSLCAVSALLGRMHATST